MGREQHAQTLVTLGGDELAHHDAALGVDSGRGFVEEEHLRLPDEGQRQGQALLLAPREPAPRRAPHVAETDELEQGVGVLGVVVVGGEEAEHLGRAQHRVDAPLLEHDSDAGHEGGVVAPGSSPSTRTFPAATDR